MTTFYAATHLRDKFATTGRSARRVLAFATRAERDRFVADYPTKDCKALTSRELSAAERAQAQQRAGF